MKTNEKTERRRERPAKLTSTTVQDRADNTYLRLISYRDKNKWRIGQGAFEKSCNSPAVFLYVFGE